MEISTTQHNRCVVVQMAGRVDTYTAPDLQAKMEALTASGQHNIILDMGEINFLSSKGLWVLTETFKA